MRDCLEVEMKYNLQRHVRRHLLDGHAVRCRELDKDVLDTSLDCCRTVDS